MRSLHRPFGLVSLLALVAAFLVVSPHPAGALQVVTVTTTADGGAGSLREAFDTANADADDTEIVLAAGATYDLTLCPGTDENNNVDGDLDYTATDDLTITGNGSTIRQTCDDERVIHTTEPSLLTLDDATITGGEAVTGAIAAGGGVLAFIGHVTVNNSTITGNSATSGGGLNVWGVATVNQSTISANSVTNGGGGLYSLQELVMTNSTVSGNQADSFGGGLVVGAEDGAMVDITYSTVVENSSPSGANIRLVNDMSALGGEFSVYGTVWSDPLGGGENCDIDDLQGSSRGYNWDTDGSCDLTDATDHNSAGAPDLGALADNGGPTDTHLPLTGSPLIDDIPVADCEPAVDVDQRGVTRPQATGCEIGSVEIEDPSTPTNPADQTATPDLAAASPVALTPRFTG